MIGYTNEILKMFSLMYYDELLFIIVKANIVECYPTKTFYIQNMVKTN